LLTALAQLMFWPSLALLLYVYFGYPLALALLRRLRRQPGAVDEDSLPSVSLIIPVYNEARVIDDKIRNTLALSYPAEKMQIIVVSDASTDGTNDIVSSHAGRGVELQVMPERTGKGAALNRGLQSAVNDIIVFSDASIMLDPEALREIVRPFGDGGIGCVSGEDYIPGGGGEGFYGRYELMIRNLESAVGSIVGASGCFYAQRRGLCSPFKQGMAPDFLSVLETIEQGYRAVTAPRARGEMRSVAEQGGEYRRKVRTMLRGITTLMHYRRLLNPVLHGLFAFELISHKLLRWLAGRVIIAQRGPHLVLAGSPFFYWLLLLQIVFYGLAICGWLAPGGLARITIFRIPCFFCMVNLAGLAAFARFFKGEKQEIWEPSKR
jgi:cellulose synthase/poly-beta-1,6-N-acetylglucosamine synthase-like glycosyltransferase